MGAEEGLVGDRECLQDTGLSGARYSCHGMTGDSSGDKACVLPPGTLGSYCCGRSPRHLETQSKPLQVPQEPPLNQAIAKWLSDALWSLQ